MRSVVQSDAVDFMKTLPDGSVDLILTDPAYESLEQHRSKGTTTRLIKDWFDIFPDARMGDLIVQSYRVLKPNSHAYIICDVPTMFVLKPICEDAGFKFWKPLIWDKVNIGMGYHYRARYEVVMFLEKGKRKLNDLSIPDVLVHKKVTGKYPTEKPVDLLRVLISNSTSSGELVVDPFSGSGSTGEAAILEGRRFMGSDISERAVDISNARINDLESQWFQ
jgi:site-specific DNA-methyltransferase (adenine-specific)